MNSSHNYCNMLMNCFINITLSRTMQQMSLCLVLFCASRRCISLLFKSSQKLFICLYLFSFCLLFLSCCSSCCSSGHFAVNQCCYFRREHTAEAAGATGAVVISTWRCSASNQCYTVTTWQHDGPTNYACVSITTDHTQWATSDFGCCTGHVGSPVKSGPCLFMLLLCKIELSI